MNIKAIVEAMAMDSYNLELGKQLQDISNDISIIVADPTNDRRAPVLKVLDELHYILEHETSRDRGPEITAALSKLVVAIGKPEYFTGPLEDEIARANATQVNWGDSADSDAFSMTSYSHKQLFSWIKAITTMPTVANLELPNFTVASLQDPGNVQLTADKLVELGNKYWDVRHEALAAEANLPVEQVVELRPSNEQLLRLAERTLTRVQAMQLGVLLASQNLEDEGVTNIPRSKYRIAQAAIVKGIRQALEMMPELGSDDYDSFGRLVKAKQSDDYDESDDMDFVTEAVSDKKPRTLSDRDKASYSPESLVAAAEAADPKLSKLLVDVYGRMLTQPVPGFISAADADWYIFSNVYSTNALDPHRTTIDNSATAGTSEVGVVDTAEDTSNVSEVAVEILDSGKSFNQVMSYAASDASMTAALTEYMQSLYKDPDLVIDEGITFNGTDYPAGTNIMNLLDAIAANATTKELRDIFKSMGVKSKISDKTLELLADLLYASNTVEATTTALGRYLSNKTDLDVRNLIMPSKAAHVKPTAAIKAQQTAAIASGANPYAIALLNIAACNAELQKRVAGYVTDNNLYEATLEVLYAVYANPALVTKTYETLAKAALKAAQQVGDKQLVTLAKCLLPNMIRKGNAFADATKVVSAKSGGTTPVIESGVDLIKTLIDMGPATFLNKLQDIHVACNRSSAKSITRPLDVMKSYINEFYSTMNEAVAPVYDMGFDSPAEPEYGVEYVKNEDGVDVLSMMGKTKRFAGPNRVKLGMAAKIMFKPLQVLENRLVLFMQYIACRVILLSNASMQAVRSSTISDMTVDSTIKPMVHDFEEMMRLGTFDMSSFIKARSEIKGAIQAGNMANLKKLSKSIFKGLGIEPDALTKARDTGKRVIRAVDVEPVGDDFELDF